MVCLCAHCEASGYITLFVLGTTNQPSLTIIMAIDVYKPLHVLTQYRLANMKLINLARVYKVYYDSSSHVQWRWEKHYLYVPD